MIRDTALKTLRKSKVGRTSRPSSRALRVRHRPIGDHAAALYRTAGEKGLCQAVFENIQGNGSAAPGLTSPFPYAGGGCAGVLGSSESIQAQLGA